MEETFPVQGDFNLHHRDLIYAMVYSNPYLTYQLNQIPYESQNSVLECKIPLLVGMLSLHKKDKFPGNQK